MAEQSGAGEFRPGAIHAGRVFIARKASKADIVEARFWLEQATMRGITDAAEYLQKWEASSAAKKTE